MKNLTDKQKKMLEFIEDFIDREGMAPTVYEIADAFDIKTSTVFAHLRALQRKNQLSRSSKARSIALLNRNAKPRYFSSVLPIPLLGRINAGLPGDSSEHKEGEVYVQPSMVGGAVGAQCSFALRVKGESMRDLGIYEDDIVIVRQGIPIFPGDIVAALVDGETTIKSFFQQEKRIELRPANPDFKVQVYDAEQVIIQGKVVGLQREY